MNICADVLSKEYHQAVAMLCARAVRTSYSKDHKQQARRDVLDHLRASLRTAATERDITNVQAEYTP
ncbi:hypothetical protein QM298_10675 [Pseudomonas mendocina]|nr:hypothetical protein [Pseudomonas mendocina]MDV5861372.1 hypothetical protein [Pseudomonas mendocina]